MQIELQYDLTRKQRLIPHLRIWGTNQIVVVLAIIGVSTMAFEGRWIPSVFAGLLTLWFSRGYIFGLLNALFIKLQHIEIRIEGNGLGYFARNEWWYIPLDGLIAVRDLEQSVWTVQHWNGTVLNIPKNDLPEETLNFLRNCVEDSRAVRKSEKINNSIPSSSK